MAKPKEMFAPQVIVETNDWFSSKEKALAWQKEVKELVAKHFPNAHIEANLFYQEQ